MRLIRKYDVFKQLTRYADGDLSLGECIDNCQTFNLDGIISNLEHIRQQTIDIGALETQGIIVMLGDVITELNKWGQEDD